MQYTIHHNGKEIRPEKQWIWSEERFLSAYRKGEIVINESNGKFSVRSKQYLRDENGVERLGKPISLLNGPFNQDGTKEIKELFDGTAIFGFPKPTKLIQYFASFVVNDSPDKDFIVLDFFSGSGSTADAVIRLNAADGGNRRFIVVQLPEDCPKESDAFKAGYETIAEVSKERIRRAGKKIAAGHPKQNVDTGFRVLKVDSSNMADIFYSPDALEKPNLDMFVDNIKPDRNSEDLLFQVMLDWGVDLALPIAKQVIQGKDVFFVDGNALAACFDASGSIDENFVKELAKVQPLRVVFRDAGFKDSSVKINVEQIFKLLSPATEVKCI